jgi:hypothetical protein
MAHQLYHFYILTYKVGCVSLAHRKSKIIHQILENSANILHLRKNRNPKAVPLLFSAQLEFAFSGVESTASIGPEGSRQ